MAKYIDIEKIRVMVDNEIPELTEEDRGIFLKAAKNLMEDIDVSDWVIHDGISPERLVFDELVSYLIEYDLDATELSEKCWEDSTDIFDWIHR